MHLHSEMPGSGCRECQRGGLTRHEVRVQVISVQMKLVTAVRDDLQYDLVSFVRLEQGGARDGLPVSNIDLEDVLTERRLGRRLLSIRGRRLTGRNGSD